MEKPEAVSLQLETSTASSEASTLPSTPEQSSPAPRERGTAASKMRRARVPKRARREAYAESRHGLLSVATLTSTISEPGMLMKISTSAVASGGLCLVVAVFSGPALVFLAVLALGVCGVCYSVRQRGALDYLPSGVVDLLTRTTLLEFLTDTSVFDAVKTYLVFMMGLSEDETQGVLASLPEDMQHTLTRPGMMHTLPRPLQDLLLPPDAALVVNGREAVGARRGRRPAAGGRGFSGGAGGDGRRAIEGAHNLDGDEERAAPPLGQLVWNPLPPPVDPAAERAAAHRETASRARAVEDDPAPSDESSVDSEQEEEEESVEEAEVGRERARSSSLARGALGGADNNRRPPWEEDPPSPVARRNRTRRRAATDVVDADEDGVQASRRVSSAHPEPARRPAAATGWFERMNGIAAGGDEAMPSAERLVVSILQRRVDAAVKAAWSVVDEQGVRRAAVGSGVALAAHMAFSERARRQAGSMLRGGLLAGLAGTATVCAGLVYLRPGQGVPGQAFADAPGRNQPVDAEEETEVDASSETSTSTPGGEEEAETSRGEVGEERLSRVRRCRDGVRRWLGTVTPSTRNLVRLLGMICLLLAVRKWQLLRRAALRATMPRSMYGSTSS